MTNIGIKQEKLFFKMLYTLFLIDPIVIINDEILKIIDIKLVGTRGRKNDILIIFDNGKTFGISFKQYNFWYFENWLNFEKINEIIGSIEESNKLIKNIIKYEKNLLIKKHKNIKMGLALFVSLKKSNFSLLKYQNSKICIFDDDTDFIYIQNKNKSFPYKNLQEFFNSKNLKSKKEYNPELFFNTRWITLNSATNLKNKIIGYFHTDKNNINVNNQNDILKNFVLKPIFIHSNLLIILKEYQKNNINFNISNEKVKISLSNLYNPSKFVLPF